jgi:hypothetical protein
MLGIAHLLAPSLVFSIPAESRTVKLATVGMMHPLDSMASMVYHQLAAIAPFRVLLLQL